MRGPLALAVVAALAIACSRNSPPREDGPRPKNVLLIVADTLRANRLGCYGYPRPTTPNIDRLAARGTLYTHSYSQACWTVPSMISMMSGTYVTRPETALPSQLTVLGETLHARGFETAAFLANATLFAERGFERGFDTFQTARMADAVAVAGSFEQWHGARAAKSAQGHAPRPFFAWVHFIDPHQPYTPSADHDVFHDPRPDQADLVERWRSELPRVAQLSPKLSSIPFEQSVSKMVADSNSYDGEVLAVDDGVGRILETLRASGELDSTLVIFCADHGEMLFEHTAEPLLVEEKLQREGGLPEGVTDLFGSGHRTWYFEDLWNTPLIIAGPGFPAGARVDGLAANLDIYPTVLEAVDVRAPAHLQGESLWRGAAPARERVFAGNFPTIAVRERSGKKLIVYPRQLFMLDGDGPAPAELYDVASDPREQRELGSRDGAEVSRLRAEIERWRATYDRPADIQTTAGQRGALVQMGYVGEVEQGKPHEAAGKAKENH